MDDKKVEQVRDLWKRTKNYAVTPKRRQQKLDLMKLQEDVEIERERRKNHEMHNPRFLGKKMTPWVVLLNTTSIPFPEFYVFNKGLGNPSKKISLLGMPELKFKKQIAVQQSSFEEFEEDLKQD